MTKQTRAILIDVIKTETSKEQAERRLEELESLVLTFGGVVAVKTIQQRILPDYATYIGKGKVNEIADLAHQHEAEVLVVNNLLKPRQLFKLNEIYRKKDIKLRAWDRVDLILKIFSQHAKSTEAKLQIELASIKHMGPRIFGMGIELSRQAGAIGLRAGQGESNTELMKRHLQKQELSILKKLEHYEKIQEGHRKRRRRQNLKTVALVGYTNAGKSSLLKALTKKDVYIADELFATLSTRVGKLYIPPKDYTKPGSEILISDTIGFIQDLPPDLIQAFKSTLAETIEADLILHVIDITDPEIDDKIKCVEKILKQLGIKDTPKIYAFNKIDLIDHYEILHKEERKRVYPVHKSNKSIMKAGVGVVEKLGWHEDKLSCCNHTHSFQIPKYDPKVLARKYKKFSPVFVSAHKKLNLNSLIELMPIKK